MSPPSSVPRLAMGHGTLAGRDLDSLSALSCDVLTFHIPNRGPVGRGAGAGNSSSWRPCSDASCVMGRKFEQFFGLEKVHFEESLADSRRSGAPGAKPVATLVETFEGADPGATCVLLHSGTEIHGLLSGASGRAVLSALRGERSLPNAHPERLHQARVPDVGIRRDVDTTADTRTLR